MTKNNRLDLFFTWMVYRRFKSIKAIKSAFNRHLINNDFILENFTLERASKGHEEDLQDYNLIGHYEDDDIYVNIDIYYLLDRDGQCFITGKSLEFEEDKNE